MVSSRYEKNGRKYYERVQKKNNQEAQARYKAAGLCAQCGSAPRVVGTVTCTPCRDRTRRNGKAYRLRLRLAAYEAYGGAKCVCCGETHLEFLTLDHVGGGGRAHRQQVGAGDKIYRWLRDNSYPEGFRVMCFNCNYAVFRYGICPHTEKHQ